MLCGLMTVSAYAGRLERAFAALEMYNYFEARNLFEKETRKHPAAAWYGLSVITGRADNPFFQIDSSHAAIERAAAAYGMLDGKDRDRLAKLGVDSAAIHAQREHVSSFIWGQVQAMDRLEEYQHFIDAHPESTHLQEAIERRDAIAFAEARRINTSDAYRAFLKRYPNAKEAYGVHSRLEESLYREATPNGTVAQYEAFVRNYPESPYARDAQDRLMDLATPEGTAGEFAAFIRRYPDNPNVPLAWRTIYGKYTKELSVKNITRFLKDYPDYPFINELMDDYKAASMPLFPFRQAGKWGYINEHGVERIKAEYDYAEPFVHSQAQVGRNDLSGTINKLGKAVIPIEYGDVYDFNEGLATVELNGKQGAVDRKGKLVIPLEYDVVGEFSHGLAVASKNKAFGYINSTGEVAVPFTYDGAMRFNNGVAVVTKDAQSGLINVNGNVVVPCTYDWVEGFMHMPLSRVRKSGYMGLINRFGEVVLAVEHDHVGTFQDSLALVIDKGKCGYVGTNGEWVIPQRYDANALTINSGDFHNGVARVLVSGKLGLVDTQGKRVFPVQFEGIGLMESNVVPVRQKSKWGYRSRSFEVLCDAKYDQAWELHGGYGRVQLDGLYGLVDSTGKETIKPQYKALSDVDRGMLVATGAAGTGLIDPQGNVLLPLIYRSVVPVGHGLAKVGLGNRFAYVELAHDALLWKEEGFGASSAD